jgi:hypothetical protein
LPEVTRVADHYIVDIDIEDPLPDAAYCAWWCAAWSNGRCTSASSHRAVARNEPGAPLLRNGCA